MIVRPYRPRDAEAIVHLYNSHSDSPNPVSGGIVEEEFQRELEERGSTVFLVAEEAGSIVGTFGMFRTNGRHTMADDEVFADMFYVTPSHRLSTVPGQLITEAISECFIQGINVIRLTVNPANISALKVYRKVGCACLGATDAGEDGNIELYNFIPLVLRATITKLDHDCIRALADMTSFACITEGRPLDLSHDFIVDAGRKIVSTASRSGVQPSTPWSTRARGPLWRPPSTTATGMLLARSSPPPPVRTGPRNSEATLSGWCTRSLRSPSTKESLRSVRLATGARSSQCPGPPPSRTALTGGDRAPPSRIDASFSRIASSWMTKEE